MDYSQESLASFVDLPDPATQPDHEAPPWPEGCPKPGVYREVPYAEYAGWRAVNAHSLPLGLNVSMRHMRAFLDGQLRGEDTPARRGGRALHCRLLEPAVFRERFRIASRCAVPLKTGPRAGQPCGAAGSRYRPSTGEWYCGRHAKGLETTQPGDAIGETKAAALEKVVASVYAHRIVKMLRQHGGCEVSLVWERDGFACKGRIDKLIIGQACPDTVIDLKTCRPCHGTEEACRKAVRQYSYDMQAAWYVDGVLRLTGKRPLFAWLFIEGGYPYDVSPWWAPNAMLRLGAAKVDAVWGMYVSCARSGRWPGYCDDIRELEPSAHELQHWGIKGGV